MLHRRGFLTGLLVAIAAPAIVRFKNIMPVKAPPILRITPVNAPIDYLAIQDWNALVQKRLGNLTEEEYALDFARRLQAYEKGLYA